ncbi:MAG: hypothetical protein IJQ88_05060 [Clostridia bacterium]|nr:hypothetical protein [Clostridia bacterium]MBQ9401530.1 hypothetical protein [Clostridia bacterium]
MAATGTPTTNIGLRRPQGTDPASVDDINYNSELIDTKLGAVGSTSVQEQINTLNSKFTKTSTIVSEQSGIAFCVAYKKAGWVTVIGHSAGQRQLTGSGSFQNFETLPEGYRPAEVQYGVGTSASGVGIAFEIGTNGLIKYLTPSNTTYWYYSFSFPVE